MKKGVKGYLALLGLVAGLTVPAGSAWATTAKTAANTQIINTATLTFTIGSTTTSATASVSVTVSLIPSAPLVSISNPGPAGYTGANTPPLTDTLTIQSTANGPALYTITPTVNAQTNNNNTASVSATPSQIWLGASITSAATANSAILSVPSVLFAIDPSLNGPNQVNGLGAGDTIVFTDALGGMQTVTIQSVNNPGTATGNATITLSLPVSVAIGTPIYEQTSSVNSANITVNPGTIVTPGTYLTVDVKASVSGTGFTAVEVKNSSASNSNPAGQPPTNLNVWTSAPASVSITKYVRNLTDSTLNPAANCTIVISNTSGTWCTSGVTGKPGHTLEYAVVAKNSATDAAGNLTNCNISDLLPPTFTTLKCNGYASNEDVHYIEPGNTVKKLKACSYTSGHWANWNPAANPNLVVYVGDNSADGVPGTLPYGQQVTITYQATIN